MRISSRSASSWSLYRRCARAVLAAGLRSGHLSASGEERMPTGRDDWQFTNCTSADRENVPCATFLRRLSSSGCADLISVARETIGRVSKRLLEAVLLKEGLVTRVRIRATRFVSSSSHSIRSLQLSDDFTNGVLHCGQTPFEIVRLGAAPGRESALTNLALFPI
jgi:hypothetical protein